MEGLYKLFLDNMPCPLWMTDRDCRLTFLNKQSEAIYNVSIEQVMGCELDAIFSKELVDYYKKEIKKCIATGETYIVENRDHRFVQECFMFPIKEGEQIVAVAGMLFDIKERKLHEKELGEQKNLLRTIIDALPEAIFYKDREHRFLDYNKAFSEYYQHLGINSMLGKTDREVYPDKEVARQFEEHDLQVMINKVPVYLEQVIEERGKPIRVEQNKKIPVLGEGGIVTGVVGLSRDITAEKILEEQLRYFSQTDMLTGLFNRHCFEERLGEYSQEHFLPLGMIMGDVNGLKLVNDTWGHLAGDQLIKDMADVLIRVCGEHGDVFRWGGDEFMILLPNCDEERTEQLAEEIRTACGEYENSHIDLSIALGYEVKKEVEKDVYYMIQLMEEKLYRQKLLDKQSNKSILLDAMQRGMSEKSKETSQHQERVKRYAAQFGKFLGLRPSEIDELVLTASLHDIGKLGVPEEVLEKEERLTPSEYTLLKQHCEKGYHMIQATSGLVNVTQGVLFHHERWDGQGYPLGIEGEGIPFLARVVSLLDAYDVMKNGRKYHKPLPPERIIEEIRENSGTQFDPLLAASFVQFLRTNQVD